MSHTPGPWKLCKMSHDKGHFEIETDKTQIAWTINAKASSKPIEEEEANAKLIALAPDMLQHLEEIHNRYASLMSAKIKTRTAKIIIKAKGL